MLFKRLLIPVAPEQIIPSSLNEVLSIANKCNTTVTLLMVIDDMQQLKEISQYSARTLDILDKVTKVYFSQLQDLVNDLNTRFENITFKTQVRIGIPFIEIIQCAREEQAEYIIIDSLRGDKHVACQRGSTTLHLMRKSEIPIWSIPNEVIRSKKVLAAVSLDEQLSGGLERKIVNAAYNFCKATNSELTLCHIWELESEGFLRKWSGYNDSDIAELTDQMYAERLRKMHDLIEHSTHDNPNFKVNMQLIKGHAKNLLSEYIAEESIDVTFLGSMSRTGIAGYLMGNKAEHWLNELETSVVTLKPDEFISPVTPVKS